MCHLIYSGRCVNKLQQSAFTFSSSWLPMVGVMWKYSALYVYSIFGIASGLPICFRGTVNCPYRPSCFPLQCPLHWWVKTIYTFTLYSKDWPADTSHYNFYWRETLLPLLRNWCLKGWISNCPLTVRIMTKQWPCDRRFWKFGIADKT